MPVQLVKPLNNTTYFPEGMYTFYCQRGEVTWTKLLEILAYCHGNTANLTDAESGNLRAVLEINFKCVQKQQFIPLYVKVVMQDQKSLAKK